MASCGILERKVNLSVTFLLFSDHIAHMQRERDALVAASSRAPASGVSIATIGSTTTDAPLSIPRGDFG